MAARRCTPTRRTIHGCGAEVPLLQMIPSNASVTLCRVTEEPQMGPEERLFRARQSWPVYTIFVVSVIVAVALILASR